jgi:hypothetical protein
LALSLVVTRTETPAADRLAIITVRGVRRRFPCLPGWTEPAAASALTLVTLMPVIIVVVQRAGRAYLPMQDQALIDLRVRDVLTFSSNTPLVGAYSHDWFNHPGPAMFYLAAPFTWLFGNAPWATLVAFALLQGLAIAWTARLAWKTGGLNWIVMWMAVVALSYLGTTPWILQRPWNPSVAFPFFILFVLQCWVVARGDPRRLLGFAFVGSFLVQAHIGYAILVVVLGGWALTSLTVQLRRQHRRIARSDLLWPAVVFAVMWFPVLVLDPVLDAPSNLERIARFFITTPNAPPRLGFSVALAYLASEFHWRPPWLGGSDRVNPLTLDAIPSSAAWLIVPAVLVVLAWWLSWRARRQELRLVAELVAVLLVTSLGSLMLVRAEPQEYLFFWRIVAGTATVVLILTIALATLAQGRWRAAGWAWTLLLALIVALGSGSFADQVAAADGPVNPIEPIEASILAQLHRDGQPDGPALVRTWGTTIDGLAAGLIDELARQGKPVFVDRSLGFEFGNGRTATIRDVRWVLIVTEDSPRYSVASTYPGARVVAVSHPLPTAQQNELVELQRHLAAVLTSDGEANLIAALGSPLVEFELRKVPPGISPQELRRLARLDSAVAAHGCLCSVVEFPSGRSPIGPQSPPV